MITIAVLVNSSVITNSPKISVACEDRGLFLAHVTCLWQIGIESAPVPCVFSFCDPGQRSSLSLGHGVLMAKRESQWKHVLPVKTPDQTLSMSCLLIG